MKESCKKLPTEEESAKNWEAWNDKMEKELIGLGYFGAIIEKDTYKVSGGDLMYMCPTCWHEQKGIGKCEKCHRVYGVSFKEEEAWNKRVMVACGFFVAVIIGLIIYGIDLWQN